MYSGRKSILLELFYFKYLINLQVWEGTENCVKMCLVFSLHIIELIYFIIFNTWGKKMVC